MKITEHNLSKSINFSQIANKEKNMFVILCTSTSWLQLIIIRLLRMFSVRKQRLHKIFVLQEKKNILSKFL